MPDTINEFKVDVSVISPVYNVEKYIEEAVDSVFHQEDCKLEMICIDDGSTDSSYKILQDLQKKYPLLRIATQNNSGAGVARNKGVQLATGRFVIFLDPDDRLSSTNALSKLINTSDVCKCPLVAGEMNYLVGNRVLPAKEYSVEWEGFVSSRDIRSCFGHTRFLVSRLFLLENCIQFPIYRRFQDPPFLEKCIVTAGGYYEVKVPVNDYRRAHKVEIYSDDKLKDYLRGVIDVLRMTCENDQQIAHEHTARCLNYWPVVKALLNTKDNTALELLYEAEDAIDMKEVKREYYSHAASYLSSHTPFDSFRVYKNRIVYGLKSLIYSVVLK